MGRIYQGLHRGLRQVHQVRQVRQEDPWDLDLLGPSLEDREEVVHHQVPSFEGSVQHQADLEDHFHEVLQDH